MYYLSWLAHQVLAVVRVNRHWMTWNLFLALVPAVLGWCLLGRGWRRGPGWWAGVVVFALFLPNAPYVVTDLIHLRVDAHRTISRAVLVVGLLPLYALFVLSGYLAYLVALDRVVREVRSVRPRLWRWQIEVPVHLACSVGIVLGRIARLNSWDTVAAPGNTLERAFAALTWRGAPTAALLVFLAVWVTTTVVRLVVVVAAEGVRASWSALAGPPPTDPPPDHRFEPG